MPRPAVPAPDELSCAVASTAGAARVTVSGQIDLATALQLGDALRHAEDHEGGMVLDLSGVEFIDCRGAQLLLATVRRARARGARFTLDGVSDTVMQRLRVTGVEHEFDRASPHPPACPSDRRHRRSPPRAPPLAAGPAHA